MEEKKNKKTIKSIIFIVIIVVLGFLAGISGEFFTRYYLSNFAFFRDLYFTEATDTGSREIVISQPKKVVVEQDLRVEQIKNQMQPTVVGIYRKKIISDVALNKIFTPSDYLGQATILTSDGWLISTSDSITDIGNNLVVTYNKKIYEIDKMVKDDLTGIVFLKITAQNMPPVQIADFATISIGQQAFVYNSYLNQLDLANISDKRYKEITSKYDFISSSQELDKYILLTKKFNSEFNGSPVVNGAGAVVAILLDQDKAVPIYYISSIISQVLKGEEVQRPYLGINYLDLSQVHGLTAEDRQGLESGALIWPDIKGVAIKLDSPLADQLEIGDIITSFEGQKISQDNDLVDILLEYKTGQEITIKYLHQGQEKEINITLK